MVSDSDLRVAVTELLERTPLRGDVERARRRGAQLRRRRRSLLAGSAASAALVFGGAFVLLGADDPQSGRQLEVVDAPSITTPSTTQSTPATVSPSPAPELPQLGRGNARGLMVDGNDLWLVSGVSGQSSALQRWNVEGTTLSGTIAVPAAARRVEFGNGYVWVFGGGDGGSPFGGITVIDPAQSREVASYGWDRPMTPYEIAFSDGAAWVTDASNDRVLRLEMTRTGLQVAVVTVGDQPTDIVATSAGDLWVRESLAGTIGRIDTKGLSVAERHQWSGALFAADGESIWTTDGARLVQLDPRALAAGLSVAQGVRIMVQPVAVAVDDSAIWVASRDGRLLRYSRDGLTRGDPVPDDSTTIDDSTIYGIALSNETVLYITPSTAGVARWAP